MFASATVKASPKVLTFQFTIDGLIIMSLFPSPAPMAMQWQITYPYYLYLLFHKSYNECNPSSISIRDRPMKAIRDCPIAFMSWNKLVDIFAN